MTGLIREKLEDALNTTALEVAEHLAEMGVSPEAVDRLQQCLIINSKGGNYLRGRTVVDTGSILSGHALSPEQTNDLLTLACLTEYFNAAYCVWDDIMDSSPTRRGQPCWYRRENVSLMAINDGCLLRSAIFLILKKRFRHHPAYIDLVELFNEAALRTELGQNCDLMASNKLTTWAQFTWDQYKFITAHKTAYYSIYLPLVLPFYYLGVATEKIQKGIYPVAMLFGLVFQARDDFLDVYGDPGTTGKVGTDIQENKCSWLSVEALQRCSEEQGAVLEQAYGSQDEDDISKVREIFGELELVPVFEEWDKKMLKEVYETVDKTCAETGVQKQVFSALLSKYFKDRRRGLPGTQAQL